MIMRTKIALGTVVALGGLTISVFLWTQNRDEARLSRAIRSLADQLHTDGRMNALTAAARSQAVAAQFTDYPRLELDLEYASPSGRAELASLVAQALMQADALDVDLRDIAVEVAADRSTARMAVTASAFVKAEGQAERIVREFEISWTRTPDG